MTKNVSTQTATSDETSSLETEGTPAESQPSSLDAAVSYAGRGQPVLPLHTISGGNCSCGRTHCTSPGKHPLTEHGLTDATTSEEMIRRWWTRWPDANVGVVTGESSSLVVVDIDARNGGTESLRTLEAEHGSLPQTVEAKTGGGRHLYFACPRIPLKSRNGLRPGIDIKGDGGYVVAPPSTHVEGRYAWVRDSDGPLADLPAWLLSALDHAPAPVAAQDGEEREVLREGERNGEMTRVAGFLRSRAFTPSVVEEELQRFNQRRCDPPLDREEVRRIAESVSGYPAGRPEERIRSAAPKVEASAEIKLRFRTAREIYAETPEKPSWVARPWVAAGAITEVVGKAKAAGKTTWLVHLIRRVLDGEPFLDQPTGRTAVVYLTEEKRGTLREALGRVGLTERDDLHFLLWHETKGLTWPQVVEAGVRRCIDVGATMLVVDTLPQFAGFKGDQENNTGNALDALAPLQGAAAKGIGVVVVRHERKSGGDVGVSGRGSSAFAGAVDIVLSISRPKDGGETRTRVISALARFDETPSHVTVELTDDGYRVVSWGEQSAGERAAAATLDAIQGLPDGHPGLTIKELMAATGIPRATLQAGLDTLVDSALAVKTATGRKGDPYRYSRPGDSAETAIPIAAEGIGEDDGSDDA